MQIAKAAEAPGTKGVVLTFAENGKRVQETYRFDPSTWFLSSCAVLEDGKLVESFDVQQLKVNAGLDDGFFQSATADQQAPEPSGYPAVAGRGLPGRDRPGRPGARRGSAPAHQLGRLTFQGHEHEPGQQQEQRPPCARDHRAEMSKARARRGPAGA